VRISIRDDVWRDQATWRYLDIIVGTVADEWHEWDVCDPEELEACEWVGGRPWVAELMKKAALAGSYRSERCFPKRVVIVSDSGESGALPPQTAARFVVEPLLIMMENRFSDGRLIDAALTFLAPAIVRKHREIAPKAIRYDSPGGNGELPKLIQEYEAKAREDGMPLRAIVLTDSDAEVPEAVSCDALNVSQACNDAGIQCCILRKRSIENYIPDEVLDAWLPYPGYLRRTLDALKRLNVEQRDHFPMKKGLKLGAARDVVKSLYQGVSVADQADLEQGFGQDVIHKLDDYADTLSADALRRRDIQGELDHLVEMIANEL
jgi:hypothetical protein